MSHSETQNIIDNTRGEGQEEPRNPVRTFGKNDAGPGVVGIKKMVFKLSFEKINNNKITTEHSLLISSNYQNK